MRMTLTLRFRDQRPPSMLAKTAFLHELRHPDAVRLLDEDPGRGCVKAINVARENEVDWCTHSFAVEIVHVAPVIAVEIVHDAPAIVVEIVHVAPAIVADIVRVLFGSLEADPIAGLPPPTPSPTLGRPRLAPDPLLRSCHSCSWRRRDRGKCRRVVRSQC